MDRQYVLKTCTLLYATHYLPMACIDERGKMVQVSCSYEGYAKIFAAIAKKMAADEDVSLISGRAGLYGGVRIPALKMLIIAGPFIDKKTDGNLTDLLIHEYGMDASEREQLGDFFNSLPRHSLNRFLNFISLINYLFNGKEITVTDFFKGASSDIQRTVGEKHTQSLLKEDDFSHGTYLLERRLLSYVTAGDVDGLSAFFDTIAKMQPVTEGKLADDTLRQSKNIFIGLICMVGKVGAIRGNLDIEQTYSLIDLYTQECERCSSVSQINQLRYSAIMDFTRRVAEQKHPQAYSAEVYMALQFIRTHTNSPIGVPDVIEHVGKSRSAFMEQFKKETGETIGRYIVQTKLKEAQLLLAYSESSLSEISNFLFFSSQSYFQNTFKKQFGITPYEYRKQKSKEH